MSETRTLVSSSSFSGSTSTSIILPRPLKRRLTSTSDLTFFTPAAESFHPLPYCPHDTYKSTSIPSSTNSLSTLAIPTQVMDPSPNDPHAVFLHPPFETFPDAHLHPEGLSYIL